MLLLSVYLFILSRKPNRQSCLLQGCQNERSSCLQAPFGKAVANYAPAYTWEPPIANVMARAGACVQLHIEIF